MALQARQGEEREEEEGHARFNHLLKPIRELADNWSVDISEDLIDYLQTLETLDTAQAINFAEAALLINGSAGVYAKKVESLYGLVFKSLETLSRNSMEIAKIEKRKRKVDIAEEEITRGDNEWMDDFLPLDDVLVCEANDKLSKSFMTGASSSSRPSLLPHVPVLLSHRESGTVGMISGNVDEASGALLFDRDERFIPHDISNQDNASSSSPPSMENNSYDASLDDSDQHMDHADTDGQEMILGDENIPQSSSHDVRQEQQPTATIVTDKTWQLLDHFEIQPKMEKPFKRGRTILAESATGMTTFQLPGLESSLEESISTMPMLHMYPNTAIYGLRSLERLCQRATISGDSLVFADLARLGIHKPSQKSILASHQPPSSRHQEGTTATTTTTTATTTEDDGYEMMLGDDNPMDWSGEGINEDHLVPLAATVAAETDIIIGAEQPSQTYADLVREHVVQLMERAKNWASESNLVARVRAWHEHVEPMLEEQESRPGFDIKQYQNKVVHHMIMNEEKDFDVVIAEAARAHELTMTTSDNNDNDNTPPLASWEVCRMFLAALQLANSGTVILSCAHDTTSTCMDEVEFQKQGGDTLHIVYAGHSDGTRKKKAKQQILQ